MRSARVFARGHGSRLLADDAAVLPFGVVIFADADAAQTQLRDLRPIAGTDDPSAGRDAEAVQFAPGPEGHDAARIAAVWLLFVKGFFARGRAALLFSQSHGSPR